MSNVPVFYTSIRPAHGQSVQDIFRRAHALGYELVEFDGWTDSDIGYGHGGPRGRDAKINTARKIVLVDACIVTTEEGADWPLIDSRPRA